LHQITASLMPTKQTIFTPFKTDISDLVLPEKFTFPFQYEPHPLSLIAAKELQDHIESQTEWEHDFGDPKEIDSYSIGKMFGVLVVSNDKNELGYISAFSGKLADANHHDRFVPPVFDMLEEGNFFLQGMKELKVLQQEVKQAESVEGYQEALQKMKSEKQQGVTEIKALKRQIKEEKTLRKAQRKEAKEKLTEEAHQTLLEELATKSQESRFHLKKLIKSWNKRNEINEVYLATFTSKINTTKDRRAAHSSNLQRQLFDSYKFLNANQETKTLNDIFSKTPPTAGAGECAAPKLLQFAFLHNLTPICMAEFWWGKSPKSALRQHGEFYPACMGKCGPILGHMLVGLDVEDNIRL